MLLLKSRRLLLGLSFLTCFISTFCAADAHKVMRISTFAEPHFFNESLEHFRVQDGGYEISTDWYSVYDANLILIFADSRNDANFVPSVLQPAFKKVVASIIGYIYVLPQSEFKGTLNADVHIIILDELLRKMDVQGNINVVIEGSDMTSCLMAAAVSKKISNTHSTFDNNFDECEEFVNGR